MIKPLNYLTCLMFVLFSCNKAEKHNNPDITLNLKTVNKESYKVGQPIKLAVNITFKDTDADQNYLWEINITEGEGSLSKSNGSLAQDNTLYKKNITYTPTSVGEHKLNIVLRYADDKEIVKTATLSLHSDQSPFMVHTSLTKLDDQNYSIALNIHGQNDDYLSTKKYTLKKVDVEGMQGELDFNGIKIDNRVAYELKYGNNVFELNKVNINIKNPTIEPKLIFTVNDDRNETFKAECSFLNYKNELLEQIRKQKEDEQTSKEIKETNEKLSNILKTDIKNIVSNNIRENRSLLEDLENAKKALEKGKELDNNSNSNNNNNIEALNNNLEFVNEQIKNLKNKIDIQESFEERFGNAQPKNSLLNLLRSNYSMQLSDIKLCLDSGADPNIKDENGDTLLHLAAYNKNEELTKLLLEKGANPNIKDKDGNTPLHDAVIQEKLEFVKILLKADADPNAENYDNKTPVDYAGYIANYKIRPELCNAGGLGVR
jgi:hypothetical protein